MPKATFGATGEGFPPGRNGERRSGALGDPLAPHRRPSASSQNSEDASEPSSEPEPSTKPVDPSDEEPVSTARIHGLPADHPKQSGYDSTTPNQPPETL